MSDFTAPRAFGAASPHPDGSGRKDEGNAWQPPGAASHAGYQQTGSPAPYPAPSQYSNQAAPSGVMGQQESYFPPQQAAAEFNPVQSGQDVNHLTSQMGAVGLGAEPVAQARHKKKDRHAYHNIEGPGGSSQAFGGMSQTSASSPYNQQSPQVGGPQWGSPQITPAMNQFPAPANPTFTPGAETSTMQYAARTPDAPHQIGGTQIASAQGRVDPEQIPSVPRSRDAPARYYLENIYPTMEHHLPPPAVVPFVAYDQGNSSPKFARLTLNNIPVSAQALATTSLPLGMIIQPLAAQQEGEQPVPVLDFGETGPPRCTRCRAYINPFMQFKAGGNKLVCNMCTYPNDVPGEYFAPTDHTGVRVDRLQRPELTLGTVDFMVPKAYWSKEPVAMRWLFLIDVSAESVNRGFLEGFCEGVLHALYGEPDDKSEAHETARRIPKGAKIGIVTFDKELHFYNLSSNSTTAQMLVMPDIDDPFVPFNDGLLVDPEESKAAITSLLTQLPSMFSALPHPEPALLPTLISAVAALSATGGKIVCSLAALPTWGPGRLFSRDKDNIYANDAEKKLFSTEHPGFKKVAEQMVRNGVGIDFFLAAPSGGYLDIATIGRSTCCSQGD